MKKGDVFINPYVSKCIVCDGQREPNPMHALIYNRRKDYCHVECYDFDKRKHEMYMLMTDELQWKVVGHIDIDLYAEISKFVNWEE